MSQDTRRSGARALRGFSLAELVCVLVIVGILAAMAAPRFANSLALQRVEAAARRVVTDLALARRHAKMSGADQKVLFQAGSSGYVLVGMSDPDRAAVDYGVSLSEEPYRVTSVSAVIPTDLDGKTSITFDAYGVADVGGSVIIRVGNHVRTIKIDAETGKASVE